jgi:hypothetical protein
MSVHEPASMKPSGPPQRGGEFSQGALDEIAEPPRP